MGELIHFAPGWFAGERLAPALVDGRDKPDKPGHDVAGIVTAALLIVACLALPSPVSAQGFDFFHRQIPQSAQTAPPADIPGQGGPEEDQTAAMVLRINRLEEQLRQANGRIEELENAERRLEDQLQKFRQDVEFRLGDRSGAATPPIAAIRQTK